MISHRKMERAYDLVEQFDFSELQESDRLFVLTLMTDREYNELRSTVKRLRQAVARDVEPDMFRPDGTSKDKPVWIRLLQYPVQLYQVAACLIFLAGLFAWLQHTGRSDQAGNNPAVNNTFLVRKTDTLITKVFDTVRIVTIIETHANRVHRPADRHLRPVTNVLPADCNTELCPAEVEHIRDLTMKNCITNDPILKDFLTTPTGYPVGVLPFQYLQ